MTSLNVDALQKSGKMRGSEWITIGVDTGAGKTAWPQSITYGTTIPGDSDLTIRTATGELVKGGKRMHVVGCDDWGSNLRVRGVQAPVCKPLLSVGDYTTMGGVWVGEWRLVGHCLHHTSFTCTVLTSSQHERIFCFCFFFV